MDMRGTLNIVRHIHRWLCVLLLASAGFAAADPVSTAPRFTFAGNMDFAVTGGTLRTQPNTGNACAVTNSDSAALTGIPVGATVVAAYLYWAGSGPTADLNVTFAGASVSADRSFADAYTAGGLNLDFFSGFADVTSRVTGNGTYSFADLTVTNTDLGGGADYCSVSAVLSGWGLAVIYEHPAEPLRVINLFDGFEPFRGGQIILNPNNFVVPAAPIDGRIGILSWEGDVENSAPFNGVTENLRFDGQSTGPVDLTDALNPLNNQFNSTINANGTNTDYGVDFDVYTLDTYLRAGDNTAQTTYASGADLVLLSLEIISVTNTAAADLSLSKSHSGDFVAGTNGQFNLQVSNLGPSAENGPVTITDTLPTALSYQGFSSTDAAWGCSAAGQTVTCSHPGPLAAGASLANVALDVLVDISGAPSVSNTASVSSPTFDPILGNNTSTDVANVLVPDLTTSTKSVVDLNGLPVQPGDTLRYTIRVTESAGAPVSGVSVTDNLSALLTNLVIVNDGGGTDASAGSTVQINDLTIPASTSVDVVFDADVVGSALAGEVISNSADVVNPADSSTTTVTSSDQTVGGIPPASGAKFLYLGDIAGSENAPVLPMDLTRVPLTAVSSPVRLRIRRQDDDRVWALTPVLQAPLSLDGSAVPVRLHLRRNNNTNDRTVRVNLGYVSGGTPTFIGCEDRVLSVAGINGLSDTVTREFVFSVRQTDANCNPVSFAPFTIPQGAAITLNVDNDPTGGSGRAIYVYPFNPDMPGTSRAELPATTVINVDSTQVFDAAFSGGSPITAILHGSDVFLRSVVSDPFGTFDISSVTYQLFDADANLVASGSLPQVQDSGADTATYEVSYSVPTGAPIGFWSVEVTANEGTEGTVSHVGGASFEVVGDNVTVSKTMRVVFDAVTGTNDPKSIPGAQVEYTIGVNNVGPSPLAQDSVVLVDQFPPQLRLFFGNPVVTPFDFQQQTPASTLSFTFTSLGDPNDDVRFSNDGGSTFFTPSVDSFGYDASVPPVDFIEFTPQGTMPGDTGSGAPGFNIVFEARLE